MSGMPWFRMYAEFATDPKIQMLSEALQRRFVMLLCLKCNGGETLQDEEVTFQLRISNEEWAETKAVFIAKNMLDENNNLTNWDKRQYKSDSSVERVKKHREKKKRQCNVTVTPPDTDTDTDTEKKKHTRFCAVSFLLEAGAEKQLAEDWLKVRKTKKLANTQTAFDGFLKEVSRSGKTINEVLKTCCQQSWGGYKPEWEEKNQPATPPQEQPKKTCSGCHWLSDVRCKDRTEKNRACDMYRLPERAAQ